MLKTPAYAAAAAGSPLAPFSIERREPGPREVLIDILFCGVCHSDIHQVRDEWGGNGIFPMVPGHEIVGRVARADDEVANHKVGGIRETREMLGFCAAYGIAADIELIDIAQVDEAYERMLRGDVRYRFVIDIGSLAAAA